MTKFLTLASVSMTVVGIGLEWTVHIIRVKITEKRCELSMIAK